MTTYTLEVESLSYGFRRISLQTETEGAGTLHTLDIPDSLVADLVDLLETEVKVRPKGWPNYPEEVQP